MPIPLEMIKHTSGITGIQVSCFVKKSKSLKSAQTRGILLAGFEPMTSRELFL